MIDSEDWLVLDDAGPGLVARVLVDDMPEKPFDYQVERRWRQVVEVGSRIRVPFNRQIRLATVLELLPSAPTEGLKSIKEVCDDRPVFTAPLLKLGKWIADYYCCPLAITLRGMLPQVVRKAESGFLQRQVASATEALTDEAFQHLTHRAPRQASIADVLRRHEEPVTVTTLLKEAGAGRDALLQMAKKGLVKIDSATVLRDPARGETYVSGVALELNDEQQLAFDLVRNSLDGGADGQGVKPILLHGVTGSGKTEVYLQAIQYALEQGKDALILVPEISLTPQTVERFKSRFQDSAYGIAVLHSHLSDGERHDEWHRIRKGEAQIVIGARSAIFAPLRKLGLIVIDEEHETSYKQEESPKYHARDVAVVRGHFEQCPVLLGSATPSLETVHNVRIEKYRGVHLTNRVDDQSMPLIRVIDMRSERSRNKGGEAIISLKLRNAIDDRLEKKEQTMLFLNRRGFSTSMLCNECGFVAECENCSVSMTYHRNDQRLVCHLCGFATKAPKSCPQCKDPKIRFPGVGTERVEAAIEKIFPKATVRRMDADTMTRRDALRTTLLDFRTGKIDILVGTQMIAKGLHFPNVTLVGIINADTSLHLPDFRSGERTFQLLTQVSGRAGRGELAGEVLIQSATPFSPAIQFARHHDFAGFLDQEMEFRRVCSHPPFTHLMMVLIRSSHQELGMLTAETIHQRLQAAISGEVDLGEPMPAPIERLQRNYRFQIVLRTKRILTLSRRVREVLDALPMPDEVHATVDVDPYQLL